MTKTFVIPVKWEMTGSYEVEAKTLEEAEQLVLDDTAFPLKQFYEDGSFTLDLNCPDYGTIKEEEQ